MLDSCLAQNQALVGFYFSPWKIGVFFILFLLWAGIGQWIDRDARRVHTNRGFWVNVYLVGGLAAILPWFLLPMAYPFFVAAPILFIILATISVIYVMHRNARVPEDERLFTVEHLKETFSRGKRDKKPAARFTFVSALGNELPVPTSQDNEYAGFKIAEDIIYDMANRRAVEARFLPIGEETQVQYTIDGVTANIERRDRQEFEQAISYLKAVANLDVKDRRRPQSGNFSIVFEGQKLPLQLQTAGSTRGEQMIIERIESLQARDLDDLGFMPDQLEAFQEILDRPSGLVLVCGPPGSGVTTTLYSIIRQHDAFTRNINALEINPLLDLDNITQHVIEKGEDLRKAHLRLQTVVRTDPDIIMVGFCSSGEMAQAGIRAARDGKKLYFGVNQPSTFHALQQWISHAAKPGHLAEALQAMTCQRLMRKLCPDCREAYKPDANMLRKLNLPAEKIKQFYRPPTEFEYDKRGEPILCETCQGSGYYGQTAVFELLIVNDNVRQLIRDKAPINAIRAQCRKDRMLYLQEQAVRKVIDGTTSIQEVLRVTAEKNNKKPAKGAGAAPPAEGGESAEPAEATEPEQPEQN